MMLLSTLAACNPSTGETDSLSETASESTSESTSESGSESETEPGEYDTTPLTLKVQEDLFPDYEPYEKTYVQTTEATEGVVIDYDVEITGDDSELLQDAARINVFDCRFPLAVQINHRFEEAGEIDYSITDYFGETLCEGKLSGKAGELVAFETGMKNHPTGYFAVNIGEKIHSYVVTPSYDSESRTLEDSPFGMDFRINAFDSSKENVERAASLSSAARLAGVTWARGVAAQWVGFEPQEGVCDLSVAEPVYTTISDTGIKIFGIMDILPSWAIADDGGRFLNNQLSAYEFMKNVSAYYKDVVYGWEIFNEVDADLFSIEAAEQYAAFFKAAALGVAAGNPDAVVALSSMCIPDSDYSDLLLANGAMNYSSVLNYHNHNHQWGTEYLPNFASYFPIQMHSTSVVHNAASKPTWVTEAGFTNYNESSPENSVHQACYLVSSTTQSLSLSNEKHFWFTLNYFVDGGNWGAFSQDMNPYPALAAEATMTDVLGQAHYVGDVSGIENYNNAKGLLFNNGSRMVAVMWTFDSKLEYTHTFETDLPVIITDIMGNQTLVEPVDGKVSVTYGSTPIYVTFSAPLDDYYASDVEFAETTPLSFTPSEKIVMTPEFEGYDLTDALDQDSLGKYGYRVKDGMTIKVRIGNYNDFDITGSVSVTIPGFEVLGTDQQITVKPFTEEFVTLTLKKTGKADFDDFFTFTGNFGEYTASSVARLKVTGKVNGIISSLPVINSMTFLDIEEGHAYSVAELDTITARGAKALKDVDGTMVVYIDEQPYDKTVSSGNEIKISLEGITEGRHIIVAAFKTAGGNCLTTSITVRFDGENYIFYNAP